MERAALAGGLNGQNIRVRGLDRPGPVPYCLRNSGQNAPGKDLGMGKVIRGRAKEKEYGVPGGEGTADRH